MSLKMIVGYDSSEHAHNALLSAIEIAKKADGSVVVVCGRKPKGIEFIAAFQPARTVAMAMKEADDACSMALKAAADEAKAAGVPVTTEAVDEGPVESLMHLAEREQADLIVVGAKGEGGLADRMFGSTVTALLQQSSKPVVVVPTQQF